MEAVYMDEKWKLTKKDGRSASCSATGRRGAAAAAAAAAAATGTSAAGEGGAAFLKASASTREGRRPRTTPRSFSSRCANLVKKQRARFYIMRRCVTMLICWRDYP